MRRYVLGGAHDIAAGLLVALELEQTRAPGFLQQVAESAEAVVGLVEAGHAALERLLDHRAPDLLFLAALGDQRLERRQDQVDRFLFLVLLTLRRAALEPLP